jgi:hypothetical protein
MAVLTLRRYSGKCKLELKYHYRKNLDNTANCHRWLEILETNKSKVYKQIGLNDLYSFHLDDTVLIFTQAILMIDTRSWFIKLW